MNIKLLGSGRTFIKIVNQIINNLVEYVTFKKLIITKFMDLNNETLET